MCVCVGARVRTHASIRAYSVLAPAFTLLLVSQFLYGLQSKAKKQTNQQQQHTHTKKVGGGGGGEAKCVFVIMSGRRRCFILSPALSLRVCRQGLVLNAHCIVTWFHCPASSPVKPAPCVVRQSIGGLSNPTRCGRDCSSRQSPQPHAADDRLRPRMRCYVSVDGLLRIGQPGLCRLQPSPSLLSPPPQ